MSGLASGGRSVLNLVMGPPGSVVSGTHWPSDDARDRRSGYRWYYHAHPSEARIRGEHGHFHLFSEPADSLAVTHLIAVSVDNKGCPIGLFAPNRWVTDECWQPASRVLRLLGSFSMAAPRSLRQAHRWLAAVLHAFSPQVRALLKHRDRRLASLCATARTNVLEDRRIAVLSSCAIDLHAQAAGIDHRLRPRRQSIRRT